MRMEKLCYNDRCKKIHDGYSRSCGKRENMWKRTGALLMALLMAVAALTGCSSKKDESGLSDGDPAIVYEDVEPDYILIDEIVTLEKDARLLVSPANDSEVGAEVAAGQKIDWVAYGTAWSIVEFGGNVYYTSTANLPVKSVNLEGKSKVEVAVKESESETETEAAESESQTAETQTTVQETTGEVQTEPVTEVPVTETPAQAEAPVTTPAAGTAVALQPYSIGAFGDLSALSNDSLGHGYSTSDRDASNRPNGCLYLQHVYGNQYGADFIIENTGSQVIYLTMDEGYEAGYTPAILDTLAEKGVKAVFFVTKQFVTEQPALVQRMIDEGHIIGNHSCAHPADGMPSLGVEGETNDIMELHNLVQQNFGYTMTLFRFPAGIFSEQSLALVHNLGYRSVFWSFAHRDWVTTDQPDPAASLQSMLDQLHPGAIYLLHAVSATNTEVLGQFIDEVRARGYEFGVYQ